MPDDDVLDGWPRITAPVRTALEVAREPDVVEAVVGLDVLLAPVTEQD